MLRQVRATLVALVFLLPVWSWAQSCAWFAGKDVLFQIQAGSSTPALSLPNDGAIAIAMNGQDCGVWVLGKTHLRKYDGQGALVHQVALQSIDQRLQLATQIAVDPYDGSVWVAGDKILAHLSSTGVLLALPAFDGVVRSVTVGLDQNLWLLGDKQVSRFGAAGAVLPVFDLKLAASSLTKRLVVDSVGGALWASTNKDLLRLSATQANQAPVSVRTSNAIVAITLEPTTGRLWLAEAGTLSVYDAAGTLVQTVSLASLGLGSAENFAFDPAAKVLWVWTKDGVARLSVDGAKEAFIPAQYGSGLLAMPAFWVQPRISLVEPPQDAITNNARRLISIAYDAQCNGAPCTFAPSYLASYSLTAALNSQQVGPSFIFNPDTRQATYTPAADLPQGINTLQAQAKDSSGRLSNSLAAQFTVDTVPPVISITSPQNGAVTNKPAQAVVGSVSEQASVLVNNVSVSISPARTFTASVTLQEGANAINLVAVDQAGNTGSAQLGVTLDTQAPPAPVSGSVTVSTPTPTPTPTAGKVTVTGATGAVEGGSSVVVTNTKTGIAVTVVAAANGSFSAQIAAAGGDGLTVSAADAAGNQSASTPAQVPGGGGNLPPDLATVATPIDPTVPTQLASSTAFLYSGANPIQTGVAAGTIESRRVAVLRGKVLTNDNQPLPGVTITVLGHPEFGQTASRASGMFDMAVNGGGYLTIDYSKAGFLPVQRTVQTPWQDYVMAPDVVMIPLDARATAIDLSAATPMQVARGGVVSDQDGVRQATLLFPKGTTATMVLPNGTTQPLTTITVRATEYTVGANGPKAMPGPLPATSGYTYAVEYSIDEAIAAGATSVQFNQPVYQYVDNFLRFPVGGIVPAGYYDRQKAAWIPSDNGVIVKILSVAGGIAMLDTTGSGATDSAARLAALNITDAERQQLATLYAAGTSFWRVPIPHFSPWDSNWGVGPPTDAKPPSVPDPKNAPGENKPNTECGSIIECQNQSLGESVPVTGTPFSLNYKSSRMPGYGAASVVIPLSGASLPSSIKRIELVIDLGGRQFTQSFPAALNQSFTFVWDGLDAYGRRLQGAQPASIKIGYVYPLVYTTPAEASRSFGYNGDGVPISADRARGEATLWKDSQVAIGAWQAPAIGLGGWTLNVQHAYDSNGQVLNLGDGRTRSAKNLNASISTVAGNGSRGFSDDDGPATATALNFPSGVTVDARGNLYIADSSNHRIRKVTPDGIISTVAGNGSGGFFGDGVPATTTGLNFPMNVTVDAQGSLYIADYLNHRIRKVTPEGIIHTVAGNNGSGGFSGDGGPATTAGLFYPYGVTVDAQGSLYIADYNNHRIRKVTPDSIIHTVAGNGSGGFSGDGGPATTAGLFNPRGVAVDAQGNLYIADYSNSRIRKVTPDGIIHTVAGKGSGGFSGDGGPATAAGLTSLEAVAVDAQGNLYISSASGRIRKVTPDGIIRTVAGNGRTTFSGDGEPATAAALSPRGVTVDAQGNLYIADWNHRIRKVEPLFPAIDGKVRIIASEDGTQLYEFDPTGRHLQTLSSTTGAVQYRFTYGTTGYLTQIADGDGNLVRVERDANDQPTAIVAPDGQRTALTRDATGYLASIANPIGETTRMTYGDGGLLTAFTNPRNQSSTITYDPRGRLLKDQNAAGGFWSFARTEIDERTYQVNKSSALGRTTSYRVENLATGDTRRINTEPDGSVTVVLQKTDGTTQTAAADGAISTIIEGPDPRFGMQAPFTTSATLKMPSGLTSIATSTRNATLSNPNDLLSLVTQTETTTVNGKVFTSVYDAIQRQVTSTSPLNRRTIVKTDALSRPLNVQATGILPVEYSYDPRGRLTGISQGTGADTRTASLAYNSQGWVASMTDALARTTSYDYDAAGRATRKTLPDGRVIALAYDANGNVTSITPPSRPGHAFTYTPVDLQQQYTPPAVAAVTAPATLYAYNLDKQLAAVTRPDNQVIQFGYDSGGRLSTITALRGTTSYAYTPTTGTLASISTSGGINLAYTYDGSLLLSESSTGAIAGSVARTYNNDFDVKTLAVAGTSYTFGYDNDGLLTSAGAMTIGRDTGNGFIKITQLGSVATTQSYNAFGDLQQYQASQGGTAVLAQTYGYDKLGRMVSKLETVQGQTDNWGYDYDVAGRLTAVSKNGAVVTAYQYDANGNRTSDGLNQASYDEQDRLIQYGSVIYTYTNNGELKSQKADGQETKFDYDVMGNLRSALLPDGKAVEYLIDGRNRRIGKKINGAITQGLLYQNQLNPVAELDGSGTVKARFIYGTKANVPDYMEKGGKTYRIVSDHLGSVRMVLDVSTGEIAQRMDYDAFGFVIQDSNSGFQPFGFAGGILDQDTRLTRFGARDYDAFTGRWTAKDPIGFEGGDSNLFSYVGGSPLNMIDPEGLWSVTLGFALGGSYQFSFGSDFATGRPFIDYKTGFGLGVTAKYDPFGGFAANRATPCQGSGAALRTALQAGKFTWGPIDAVHTDFSSGIAVGTTGTGSLTMGGFTSVPKSKAQFRKSWNWGPDAKLGEAALGITFYGSGGDECTCRR